MLNLIKGAFLIFLVPEYLIFYYNRLEEYCPAIGGWLHGNIMKNELSFDVYIDKKQKLNFFMLNVYFFSYIRFLATYFASDLPIDIQNQETIFELTCFYNLGS